MANKKRRGECADYRGGGREGRHYGLVGCMDVGCDAGARVGTYKGPIDPSIARLSATGDGGSIEGVDEADGRGEGQGSGLPGQWRCQQGNILLRRRKFGGSLEDGWGREGDHDDGTLAMT